MNIIITKSKKIIISNSCCEFDLQHVRIDNYIVPKSSILGIMVIPTTVLLSKDGIIFVKKRLTKITEKIFIDNENCQYKFIKAQIKFYIYL